MPFPKGHNLGGTSWNKGMHHPEEIKIKISLAESGEKHYNWKGGLPKCKCGKILSTRKTKNCTACAGKLRIGERHPMWIENRNELKETREKSYDTKYKYWMFAVKKRDGWKCKILSSDCKGRLEAHHILNWRDFPELRYKINNGITLCHAHHPRGRENEAKLSPYLQSLVAEKN